MRPERKEKTLRSWEAQELDGERIMGGTRTPGSGCGKQKGDVRSRLALCEMKTTRHSSRRVTMEELCKICREAGPLVPVFVFGFDEMPRGFSSDWYALPAEKFDALMRVLESVAEGDMKGAQQWLKTF